MGDIQADLVEHMSIETLFAILRYCDGRNARIEIDDLHDALDVPDDAFPPDFALGCKTDDTPLLGALRFERTTEPMHGRALYDQRRVDGDSPNNGR